MKIAYHFNASSPKYSGFYGIQIQELLFGALLRINLKDLHIKIHSGDLLTSTFIGKPGAQENVLERLLGYDMRNWRAMNEDAFSKALFSARIYVLAVEGLDWKSRDLLHAQFGMDDSYLGALQVNEANQIHWVLYNQFLKPTYRIVGNELRIFYYSYDEASKDTFVQEHWAHLPFKSIVWEDLGDRGTILDSSDTFERAKRLAELGDYLSLHLAHLADDVLLRLNDLDRELPDKLHAAMRNSQIIETTEDVAQACLSCRRLLEGLADVLYPPNKEPVNGHKVGQEQYINRLRAYIGDKLKGDQKDLMDIQLLDIGERIKKGYELANKGAHSRISRTDLHRLISALLVATYDLLSLDKPPLQVRPRELDADEVNEFLRKKFSKEESN